MENWGTLLGIVIAISMGAWFRNRDAASKTNVTRLQKFGRLVLIILVVSISAGLASIGGRWLRQEVGGPSYIDAQMAQMERAPFLGTLIRMEPAAAQEMRMAIERSRTNKGGTDLFDAGFKLRRVYLGPVLRSADSQSLQNAWSLQASMVRHLNQSNHDTCVRFMTTGIQNISLLDNVGQAIVNEILKDFDKIYASYRGRSEIHPTPTDEIYEWMGMNMDLTADEWNMLMDSSVPAQKRCDVGLRMYEGIGTLGKIDAAKQARILAYFMTGEDPNQ